MLERFFDESGGMQLVLHAPFGSRVTKAWGLALRKRFCRQFNFELQAAATEDGLMLSLGPQHSFPLADVFRYLHPETTRDVLVQAFLDAPVFETRWRWNATLSLAVPRARGARKLAPQVQRMLAADLLASVFPDAAACLENIPGDRQIPDHPLVGAGGSRLPRRGHGPRRAQRRCSAASIAASWPLVARDTPEPSAFAHEILGAAPYAFLDDAPLEERRSHAVQTRRGVDEQAMGWGRSIQRQSIAFARKLALKRAIADELHDALMTFGFLRHDEIDAGSVTFLDALAASGRACRCGLGGSTDVEFIVVAAERVPELLAVHPALVRQPCLEAPASRSRLWERDAAIVELLRSRMCLVAAVTADELAQSMWMIVADADRALLALEGDGAVLRGRFHPRSTVAGAAIEWCDRALLARIHRYTLNRLRAEIEPVSPADFMRFLFKWQHATRPIA